MGLYLWLTLYLYRTAQASRNIFLSGFLPDGNVQRLLFFLQNEVLSQGEHEAPESPESTSSLPLSVPPTFWPAWPVLSAHGELHALAMPWLFPLLSWALSTARLHTEAISLPLQGKLTGSHSGETSHIPCPTCSHTASPSCFRDPGLHLYYNTSITWLVVHLFTVSMAISPSGS